MIIGVFSPVINWCGGAEWVGVNVISALKQAGHEIIILADETLNQKKFMHIFKREVLVDRQIILPFRFFSPTNYHNLYTDAIRSLILKSKCDIVVDTFSNAILPGINVSYIHYPLLRRVHDELSYRRNQIYFLPYRELLNHSAKKINKKLVFVNSKFTAEATEAEIGVKPHVLYPPVSDELLYGKRIDFNERRKNNIITISRISYEKNLEVIPYLASLVRKDIFFIIVGLLDDIKALNSLLRLTKKLDVSDRVKILVDVKRERLRSILRSSKVYFHPKVGEHFGISIIEGMASGCVPIVHDSGGPRELVPSNRRFGDIDEAADIVGKAIDNWSPIQSRNSFKFAERFSERNFSKNFMSIFNTHLQKDAIMKK